MRKIILFSAILLLGSASALQTETLRLDDVLNIDQFVLGDTELWPRTGDHGMNQVFDADRKFLFFVKIGNPRWYEVWSWDDTWAYLHEDRGADAPYSFTDGRWLKRRMKVGEVIDSSDNYLISYNLQCQVINKFPFPYKNALESYWPKFDWGPDLGSRETIVLRYTPFNNSNYYERSFFAKGAGWVAWQEWQYGVLQHQTVFNRLGGLDVKPGVQPCRPPRR